jgi:hypothetical protein
VRRDVGVNRGVALLGWLKKPGIDGETIPGMYTGPLFEPFHGLAVVAAVREASATTCFRLAALVFFAHADLFAPIF